MYHVNLESNVDFKKNLKATTTANGGNVAIAFIYTNVMAHDQQFSFNNSSVVLNDHTKPS